MVFRPSAVERSSTMAREFLEVGDNTSALEVIDEGLNAEPSNEGLQELAVEAAEGHARYLEETLGASSALDWLREEMEASPHLAPARQALLRLEARSAVDEVLGTPEMSNQYYPEPLESLVARFSNDPEVPFTAAGLLAGEWHAMTVLWLYRLALEEGGFAGDDGIFTYCASSLTSGDIDYLKFETAEGILLEFFPERAQAWARETLGSHEVQAYDRAWHLLGEVDDPLREDPYYLGLAGLVSGREVDMPALFEVLAAQEDPLRRDQIVALHTEFVESYPRFTAYRGRRDQAEENLNRLREAWGRDPHGGAP